MGASIHISGTGSSTVDTVFVCRVVGAVPLHTLAGSRDEIVSLVLEDLRNLAAGGVRLTPGDVRCVVFGHVVRLAIWNLRKTWDAACPVAEKLAAVEVAIAGWDPVAILAAAIEAQARAAPALGPLFEIGAKPIIPLHDDVPI
jgi:putative DNA methylase